jgi:hypothetical protein
MRPDDCTRDAMECRITVTGSWSTLLAWMPVYDGNGRMLESGGDPNTHTTRYACGTYGKTWTVSRRNGSIFSTSNETPP